MASLSDESTDFRPRQTPTEVFDSTLSLLQSLAAVSSPSGDVEGLTRVTHLYAEALGSQGLETSVRLEEDEQGVTLPVLTARVAGRGRLEPAGPSIQDTGNLLVVGHLDTVLPAAPPRLVGNRLWATGAVDMKGGLACLAGALELLRIRDQPVPDDLEVLVVPDEEVAGAVCRRLVKARGRQARAVWVLEPGQPASQADVENGELLDRDAETLVVGRRGLMTWSLDVGGRAAHAGNGFWRGKSALVAAAEWVERSARLSRPGLGPTVNAARLVSGERQLVEALADQADLLFSPRQTNVVPDRARVEGEMRFRKPAEGEELVQQMVDAAQAIAEARGTSMDFQLTKSVPPLPAHDPSLNWARLAERQAAEQGWQLRAETDRRGISFPNMLEDPSRVPTLDGLGPVGGGMHTREEFVELRSLDRRIALLADLLALEGGAGPQ